MRRPGWANGRQRCGNHDGGGVVDADRRARHGDAHSLEHIGEALSGEQGLAAIAGAGETDYETVADELVIAHAFDGDEILEARGGERSDRGQCNIAKMRILVIMA